MHAPCTGMRTIRVGGLPVEFEHTSLTIDGGQHLRLVVYAQKLKSTDA